MGHGHARKDTSASVSHVLLFFVEFHCLDVAHRCKVHDRCGRAGLVVVVARWEPWVMRSTACGFVKVSSTLVQHVLLILLLSSLCRFCSRADACVSSAERALSYLKGAGYGHVTRQSSLSSDAPDEDEVIRPRLRVLS